MFNAKINEMKEKLIVLIVWLTTVTSYCQIINFPDSNFKDDLLHHNVQIDTNNDGEIDVTEAQNFSGDMFVGGGGNIYDVTGIHHFVNIKGFFLRGNLLTELDLSNNLKIRTVQVDGNKIRKISLGNNMVLEHIYCSFNKLIELDLSKHPSLRVIQCNDNPDLTTLDIANGNNNVQHSFFAAHNNPKLTCINIDRGFTPPTNATWSKDATASYSHLCIKNIDSEPIGFPSSALPESSIIENSNIAIYPNPTANTLHIQCKEQIKKLSLYTLTGENVLEKQNTNELNVAKVKKGIYWLAINTGNKIIRKKVIKE